MGVLISHPQTKQAEREKQEKKKKKQKKKKKKNRSLLTCLFSLTNSLNFARQLPTSFCPQFGWKFDMKQTCILPTSNRSPNVTILVDNLALSLPTDICGNIQRLNMHWVRDSQTWSLFINCNCVCCSKLNINEWSRQTICKKKFVGSLTCQDSPLSFSRAFALASSFVQLCSSEGRREVRLNSFFSPSSSSSSSKFQFLVAWFLYSSIWIRINIRIGTGTGTRTGTGISSSHKQTTKRSIELNWAKPI